MAKYLILLTIFFSCKKQPIPISNKEKEYKVTIHAFSKRDKVHLKFFRHGNTFDTTLVNHSITFNTMMLESDTTKWIYLMTFPKDFGMYDTIGQPKNIDSLFLSLNKVSEHTTGESPVVVVSIDKQVLLNK
jgi:hypothetical protein